jgi:hypothetical protein
MTCNEIAARLETQCRRYLYKKLGICAFCTHKNKSPVKATILPTKEEGLQRIS